MVGDDFQFVSIEKKVCTLYSVTEET